MPRAQGKKIDVLDVPVEDIEDEEIPAAAKKRKNLQAQIEQAALTELAKIGGQLSAEEDVTFTGRKYVLPESTDLRAAIQFLTEKQREDEKEFEFSRTFKYRPYDGARATMAALKRAFGVVTQRSTFSMFGENPPHLVTVPTGPDTEEQVPWGAIGVPILPDATLYTQATADPELGTLFVLAASCKRKHRFHMEGIFKLVEQELITNSMYRGKAIDGQQMPSFLDLDGVDPEKVIYSNEVITQLEANLWSLLRWPDTLAKQGVSMKRAVLLEGPYGSGKTLAAYLTAQEAVANGVTFIYCRPGKDDLEMVMQTARLYEPAVVFFEDVDVVAAPDEESDRVSKMLDAFDGIRAKGTRILCVLTTNHAERLHKGMLRPGRLDAIVHIGALDRDGVERLVKACVQPGMLSADVDFDAVNEAFEGFLPAFGREAIDRAVRYNVSRNKGEYTELETADFVEAANGLRPQLQLMEDAGDVPSRDPIGLALMQGLTPMVEEVLSRTAVIDTDEYPHFHLLTKSPEQEAMEKAARGR